VSTVLDVLYHWSPTVNRTFILRNGLRVYSRAKKHSKGCWPYICLSPRPSLAWSLSAGVRKGDRQNDPIEDWDLWEVRPPDDAEIHVREFWWPKIEEFKVYSSIPPDCLWFVGQRPDMLVALDKKRKKPLTN